jgi:hypothetical protein
MRHEGGSGCVGNGARDALRLPIGFGARVFGDDVFGRAIDCGFSRTFNRRCNRM